MQYFCSDVFHKVFNLNLVLVFSTIADMEVIIGHHKNFDFSSDDIAGVLFQYPDTNGLIQNFEGLVKRAQEAKVKVSFYLFQVLTKRQERKNSPVSNVFIPLEIFSWSWIVTCQLMNKHNVSVSAASRRFLGIPFSWSKGFDSWVISQTPMVVVGYLHLEKDICVSWKDFCFRRLYFK